MANKTTEEYHAAADDDVIQMTPGVQVPSAIGLTILIIIGISGNCMTIAAYLTDRKLNSIYNFFICNLAVNDLLICVFSMPIYTVYTLMEFHWPFGYSFCKVYNVLDFTFCFESILHMLILSLDRLFLITFGPIYIQKMTRKLAGVLLAVSWVISFSIYGPAIIGWNHWVGYSTIKQNNCDVEFANDFAFTSATAIVEFILPSVFLTSINAVIYYKLRQRLKVHRSANTRCLTMKPSTSGTNDSTCENNGETVQRSFEADNSEEPNNSNQPQVGSNHMGNNDSPNRSEESERETGDQPRRHVKAAKFLAVLVAAFVILWAPYTVSTVIISFCENCVNTSLYKFFVWVLWMKSAVNPFLYAYNSLRYRRHFTKYVTLNYRLYKLKSKTRRVNAITSTGYSS